MFLSQKSIYYYYVSHKPDRDVTPFLLLRETATKHSLPSSVGFTQVSRACFQKHFPEDIIPERSQSDENETLQKHGFHFAEVFFSSCAHSRVRDKSPCTAIMIKIKILPLNMKICATQATNCSISLQGPWACIYSQVSGHCGWGVLFHFV